MVNLGTNAKARKEIPIARGVFDYFPDAIAAVANVSFVGNEQHNPGEELHWAREKSNDHADCIARHLIERGTLDTDKLRHSAKGAWRSLALLQLEIEADAANAETLTPTFNGFSVAYIKRFLDANFGPSLTQQSPELRDTKIPSPQMIVGTPVNWIGSLGLGPEIDKTVYIAGPMRGYEFRNFPAFDEARDLFISEGWDVISPADIDREVFGGDPITNFDIVVRDETRVDLIPLVKRDVNAICSSDAIALLPGWEKSTGAVAEFFIARWLGIAILDATTGRAIEYTPDVRSIMASVIDYIEEFV